MLFFYGLKFLEIMLAFQFFLNFYIYLDGVFSEKCFSESILLSKMDFLFSKKVQNWSRHIELENFAGFVWGETCC